MDPRLDPTCKEARELELRHKQQDALLVVDRQSQLANVVRGTQERQLHAHKRSCTRCHGYTPGCPECGFDPRAGRHGWMCPQQSERWKDVLPWNWRPRFARGDAPSAQQTPAGASRRIEVREREPSRGGRRVAAPPTPGAPAPTARSGPAGPAPPPKPRPKPAAPKSDALQLAYQALGVSPSASDDQVRAAYRAKAQQYHPDKVATMAPEFRDLAEKKMIELNGAYERVKRAR